GTATPCWRGTRWIPPRRSPHPRSCGRQGRGLRVFRCPVHGVGRGVGRRFLAGRASHPAADARRPAPPPRQRGRVQLRHRGAHGGQARRRRRVRGEGASGLQAARPVAHVLERRRRGVPDPGDHLPRRVRAPVRRDVPVPRVDDRRARFRPRRSLRPGGRLRQRGAPLRGARASLPRRGL
ncbi:MAG: hypothetical protein AVDCRST_MAG25-267, partial [uncultured Rubrobacteraceae bacterium]